MTDTNKEREAAEQWLRDRYGAYRGHFAWRELEEAFLAGRASLAASAGTAITPESGNPAAAREAVITSESGTASAGSEPVAHLWQHGETGRTRVVLPEMIVDADASWRLVGPLFLGSHPSPPEGAGWKWVPVEPTKAMLLAGSADLRLGDCIGTLTRAAECYRSMIAAAPPASEAKGA